MTLVDLNQCKWLFSMTLHDFVMFSIVLILLALAMALGYWWRHRGANVVVVVWLGLIVLAFICVALVRMYVPPTNGWFIIPFFVACPY